MYQLFKRWIWQNVKYFKFLYHTWYHCHTINHQNQSVPVFLKLIISMFKCLNIMDAIICENKYYRSTKVLTYYIISITKQGIIFLKLVNTCISIINSCWIICDKLKNIFKPSSIYSSLLSLRHFLTTGLISINRWAQNKVNKRSLLNKSPFPNLKIPSRNPAIRCS